MNVLFDVSIFGWAYCSPMARAGIFRMTEQLVLALAENGQCSLRLCASANLPDSIEFWRSHSRLAHRVPFPSRLSNSWTAKQIRSLKRRLARFYFAHQDRPWIRHTLKYGGILPLYLEQLITQSANRKVWQENLAFAQVYHAPHYEWPEQLRDTPRVRRFATIHDMIPIHQPQFFSGDETLRLKNLLSRLTPENWVICPSQSTRYDVQEYFSGHGPQCRVVPWAADTAIFHPVTDPEVLTTMRRAYRIGERPYILSLCTLEPRKNLATLVRAFVGLCEESSLDAVLVMVGSPGWQIARFMEELSKARRYQSRIVLTGFVPDQDLAALYSGATVFVYPSLYEGFGLPVLEAMQCGTPVITSRTSSMPEVAGDAAVLVDPTDEDALAQVMLNVMSQPELCAELKRRSLAQAARFSWRRCAADILRIYQEAVA